MFFEVPMMLLMLLMPMPVNADFNIYFFDFISLVCVVKIVGFPSSAQCADFTKVTATGKL